MALIRPAAGYDDFVQYFKSISVCMLPTGWQGAVAHGEWAGKSAGGCPNYDSVSDNPQFLLSISRPVNVVLTLTQGDGRVGAGTVHDTESWEHASIGMCVCSVARAPSHAFSRFLMPSLAFSHLLHPPPLIFIRLPSRS